ncbi:MAG: hypothetical protein ABJN69_07740 [Hellea sp.]
MIAAFSLLLIFAISFFLVRLASVALRLTGLPEQNARFQAMSALTGTGFTTTEAEMVVNYPIRRKIISWLMVFGNLGIVSVLSTLMISFIHIDADMHSILLQLAWMIGMTILFFVIMLNPLVDGLICGLIGFVLEKCTFLGGRHYRRLLQLGNELSISEHQFFASESLSPDKVMAELGNFSVLAVKRKTGKTEAYSLDMGLINPGDSLILFGHDNAHDGFKAS